MTGVQAVMTQRGPVATVTIRRPEVHNARADGADADATTGDDS